MPRNPAPGESDQETLWRLYEQAVEEYRFQVNLNWQRTQYFLGLDVAILGVATGLLRLGTGAHPSDLLPGLVFVAGVLLSLCSVFLTWQQHDYYRHARDQVKRLRDELHVGDRGIVTTSGSRDEPRSRWLKVRAVIESVLLTIAGLNAVGAAYAFTH